MPRFFRARFAALPVILALVSCGDSDGALQTPQAPPVTVAQPVVQETVEWDEYTGRFQAVDFVEIRARVSGYLDRVAFEDGETVNQGDLLFVIDQRPFRIALQQAEAELTRTKTRLTLAERDLSRAESLIQRGNISQQMVDERRQEKQDAEAAVTGAEAAVRAAQLNLEFTEVRAPISGRVSRDLVTVGNLISGGTSGSTLLTTIVSLDPIHFYFDADEAAYLRYSRLARTGDRPSSRDEPNTVQLSLMDENDFRHEGYMDFVDNTVDLATGTVQGRALLDNPDLIFTPGMFARLRLIGSGKYDAVLIPDEAVGTDQARKFVYVVDDANTVEYRTVELGPIVKGLRVVRSGLAEDEWIVINGLQRARPGGQVAPERSRIETQTAKATGG